MVKKIQSFVSLLFATSLQAQPALSSELMKLAFSMRANNLYHQLVWDFVPLNAYLFDQNTGTITYNTESGKRVVAKVEIMGSYFLGDKTFLWADKNISVDKRWCTKVDEFRALLPKACQEVRFTTNVEFLKILSAAFGGHLHGNAVDYVRQEDTIIFFALLQVEVFDVNNSNSSITLAVPSYRVVVAFEQEKLLKEYLQKYIEINQHYIKSKNNNTAFDALDQLKAAYFEGFDDFLPLQDPIDPIVASGRAFASVIFDSFPGRLFIIYSSGEATLPDKHRAYEVRKQGGAGKPFLRSFEIYGL